MQTTTMIKINSYEHKNDCDTTSDEPKKYPTTTLCSEEDIKYNKLQSKILKDKLRRANKKQIINSLGTIEENNIKNIEEDYTDNTGSQVVVSKKKWNKIKLLNTSNTKSNSGSNKLNEVLHQPNKNTDNINTDIDQLTDKTEEITNVEKNNSKIKNKIQLSQLSPINTSRVTQHTYNKNDNINHNIPTSATTTSRQTSSDDSNSIQPRNLNNIFPTERETNQNDFNNLSKGNLETQGYNRYGKTFQRKLKEPS
jgi:hypothetical protein